MDSVNKTLYIPLYGKAFVSRQGLFLRDPAAEAIWAREGFPLKGKAASKWLAYNMGMRSAVFDRWLQKAMDADPGAVILHLGCGLDSRNCRVEAHGRQWFDVDFPQVIRERQTYWEDTACYHQLPGDIREEAFLDAIPGASVIVVLEGVSMYLTNRELQGLMQRLDARFDRIRILMDGYTRFAARATKYKNPINQVGVTQVYGFDDPSLPVRETSLGFCREHSLTPGDLIAQLPRGEQGFFRLFFAGKLAKKIYRLYEYEKAAD